MHVSFASPPVLRPYGVGALAFTLPELATAITRQEGACTAPTVCRNNNPGNLRAYASGQPVDSRGIRIFPTYEDGYNALLSQERVNISKGLTVDEFFAGKPGVYPGYAPAADRNQPSTYAGNVSAWLGIPRDVPLSDLLGDSAPEPVYAPSPVFTAPDTSAVEPDPTAPVEDAGLSTPAKIALALGLGAAIWAAA